MGRGAGRVVRVRPAEVALVVRGGGCGRPNRPERLKGTQEPHMRVDSFPGFLETDIATVCATWAVLPSRFGRAI